MDKIEKVLQTISSRLVFVCAVISVGWVFVFTAYIISRFFNLGWIFVEEFTGYWLVLIAYIPLAYALMTDAHIKVEIVTNRLTQKIRSISQVCTDVIALIFVFYLLGRSIEWLIHGIEYGSRSSTALNIPLWPIYLFIPVGLALFGAMFIVKITHSMMEFMQRKVLVRKRQKKLQPP